MGPEPGLQASVERTVNERMTAVSVRSGDIEVLATPVLVGMCEWAAVRALHGHLPENETTVGVQIDLQHLAPTGRGRSVVATARLETVDGRKLVFSVAARDGKGEVAHGRHVRMRVDRERFMRHVDERS